jgi:hypothetical protein
MQVQRLGVYSFVYYEKLGVCKFSLKIGYWGIVGNEYAPRVE